MEVFAYYPYPKKKLDSKPLYEICENLIKMVTLKIRDKTQNGIAINTSVLITVQEIYLVQQHKLAFWYIACIQTLHYKQNVTQGQFF